MQSMKGKVDMTDLERKHTHIKKSTSLDDIGRKHLEIGTVLVKETVRYLENRGYDASRGHFLIDEGYPAKLKFLDSNGARTVSYFSFMTTRGIDEWLNSDKNLFVSLNRCKDACMETPSNLRGTTFQEFISEIQQYYMRENRYDVDEDMTR